MITTTFQDRIKIMEISQIDGDINKSRYIFMLDLIENPNKVIKEVIVVELLEYEYGISFDGDKPHKSDYFAMSDEESANRLADKINRKCRLME